jgi:hypothetical protein
LYTADKNLYIRLDKNAKPLIRQTPKGREMLLPVGTQNATITYSIIW